MNELPLISKGLCWGETHQMKKAEDEPYVPINRVTRLSKNFVEYQVNIKTVELKIRLSKKRL